MRTKRTAISSAIGSVCVFLLAVQCANAKLTIFQDRDQFNSALDDTKLTKTVEGWDTYPAGTIFPNGATVNGITYNVSTGQAIVLNTGISFSPPNNLFETTPENFRPLVDTYTFGFHVPIRAFGITFSSTFATGNGDYLLTTNRGDVVPSFFDPLFPGFPLGQFAGFISNTPVTSVTVSSTANAHYGMDDLIFARPGRPVTNAPEPSTLLLIGTALLGAIGFRSGSSRSARAA